MNGRPFISPLRVLLMTIRSTAFSPLSEQQPAEIRPSSMEVAWPITAGLGVKVLMNPAEYFYAFIKNGGLLLMVGGCDNLQASTSVLVNLHIGRIDGGVHMNLLFRYATDHSHWLGVLVGDFQPSLTRNPGARYVETITCP
ncbi:hypothetical protein AVEN_218917-1 [Araneus ventricosus]|uniref:Uncharacterized protein n=1 Tax=Araneus ventricosus TaxID=182803 RepID=A0A4Y2NQA7_ARAVE|nr:hypothetical protein AVEN_218917-1 [Araneus ventricosus]